MYKTAVGVGWLQTALLQKRLPCIVNLVRCRFPLSLALYLALYLSLYLPLSTSLPAYPTRRLSLHSLFFPLWPPCLKLTPIQTRAHMHIHMTTRHGRCLESGEC